MKKVVFILALAVTAMGAKAQVFEKGTNMVNVGVGFGTALGGLGTARPAISASYEHGLWDIGGPGVISLGGYIGNTGYKYNGVGYRQKWNYTIVGARAAYHYNGFSNAENFDLYGGLMLSYNIVSYSDNAGSGLNNAYGSGLGLTGFIGGRYLFTDNIGAFAELGYGVSVLNVGVSFKF
ncbi:MAG TPA: hypothetical protein PK339_15855 [Flavitalea sp.]|nr:hypothetical protein [Flavitalea sp.]